ncbi:MAG TPA: hypothetical protein VFO10_10180 [Oligoflexus sp.]|uniref:hypothetical protein n=1 Tax=Oligoflexus sp. TaxID=1971216 RepID=UPI002D7E7E2C|nr:hypothetical protein [Oligoflexus sp.]HET9237609.1 hypothetical protein [Oligoflexus sp.]
MASKITKKSFLTGVFFLSGLFLSSISQGQNAEGWIDSRPFLIESPRPVAEQSLIFTKPLFAAINRSLMNPEQHRQLLDLQARTGTKAQETRLRSLSVYKLSSNITTARPTDVTRSMSTFLGREFKSTALPESLRTGISFNIGGDSNDDQTSAHQPLRYGLIVKNVEPSPDDFRMASVPMTMSDDYMLVQHAPKARVQYEIGPLMHEAELTDSSIPLATAESSSWMQGLPEFQFRGRIAARGEPTANQILPPQSILLEQSQGFYAIDIHTSQLLHKDAVFHRIRVPLVGTMTLREERNEKFKKTRSTLENIYVNGPLALNLDYFGLEKRYQTGLIYQRALTRIELYNHLPEDFSTQGGLWKTQRFELKLQTAF